jgi:pimeloyl-ACP methyl ester carboxylesterase
MATESGFVRAPDGIRLHYVRIGTDPRVLIAPGVGNEADFAPLARRRTVVFFDIRNRGRSDPVPPDGEVGFPVEVDDIDTVRRHLGLERVDVIGWSYVGLVGALHAARYPRHVDRLVMVCPAPLREAPLPPPTEAEGAAAERIAELRERGIDRTDPVAFARAWRRMTAPLRMGDPAAFERLRGDPAEWPNEWPDHLIEAMARVMGTQPRGFDHRDEARRITAPTLVVAGEVDRLPSLAAATEWARAIPAAQLVVLPRVGHYPQVEAPDDLFEAVDRFLAPN